MSLVVNEYEIPFDTMVSAGRVTIDMPIDWEALDIAVDADGKLTLYALVYPDAEPCPVHFYAYPTGVELDFVNGGGVTYLGSVQLDSVWHVFWS